MILGIGCRHTLHLSDYRGSLSVNAKGSQCQPWLSQHPYRHPYMDDNYFPGEGLLYASNYCRSPDGADYPWCYSMDNPGEKVPCKVPFCSNGRFLVQNVN